MACSTRRSGGRSASGVCRYIDVHQLREVPDEEEIAEQLDKISASE